MKYCFDNIFKSGPTQIPSVMALRKNFPSKANNKKMENIIDDGNDTDEMD